MKTVKNSNCFVSVFSIVFLLTAAASKAGAATYYVAKDGSGDYTNIVTAYSNAQPGDTIIVKPDIYTEHSGNRWGIHLNRSGTAGAPITLKSQTKWQAVLDGENNADRYQMMVIDGNCNIVDGFEIKNGWAHGLQVRGNYNRILNCNIHNNGNTGPNTHIGQDGIYSDETTHHNAYIGNYVHHNGRLALDSKFDHGLYLCGDNEMVANNIVVYNCSYGLQIAGYGTVTNLKVYNNIFAFNGRSGMIFWLDLDGIEVKNNIFYKNAQLAIDSYDAHGSGVVVDRNIYYGNIKGDTDYDIVSDFSYTLGTNYSGQDPIFVSDSSDWHLSAGSPAIDEGVTVEAVATDFDGNARPQGLGYDIGAYEYVLTVSGKASNPSPVIGTKNADPVSTDLSWTAGVGATSRNVYFGTANPPPFIANQTATVYDLNSSGYDWSNLENLAENWLTSCPPSGCSGADLNDDGIVDMADFTVLAQQWMAAGPTLEAGKTYYWRIDEDGTSGAVTGDLWSFATTGGPRPECMVSHWKLDETSGTVAIDSSGNGHTGTLVESIANSLTWQPTAGHSGGTLSFDGDGPANNANSFCRVEVPTAGLSVSAGTIAFWAELAPTGPNNYSARNNYLYLFSAKGSTTGSRIYLRTLSTDLGLDIGIGGATDNNVFIMTRSIWHHIAITWESNIYTVYVNGWDIGKTGSSASLAALPVTADIGNKGESTYNQSMHGLLDDVRVYSCALTAEEIVELSQ